MKINKKPKISVVSNIKVEQQSGLDCMLYSTLNLIRNSSLGKKRPTDIDHIREQSQFAKTTSGYYTDAVFHYLNNFYKDQLEELAFSALHEKQQTPRNSVTDSLGIIHENFKSQESFLQFLEDLEKNEVETIFSYNRAGGHGSLNHQIGILFNGKSYTEMDSLSGAHTRLSSEQAKNILSKLTEKGGNCLLYAKIKKTEIKILKKSTSKKIIKIIRKK